jgi:hypothetical protein
MMQIGGESTCFESFIALLRLALHPKLKFLIGNFLGNAVMPEQAVRLTS